jgi:Raf kinase inhibitor-like YbhB/YbcL family protein
MPVLSLLLAFQLFSSSFEPNATVPVTMVAKDCGGQNVSPQLHWNGAPKGTKSFALIVHDPDAPHPGGFYHWVVQAIPANVSTIDAGTTKFAGYYGPCPPPGKVHHYHFTLYALDERIDEGDSLDAQQLQERIKGHILAQTTLTGLYEIK